LEISAKRRFSRMDVKFELGEFRRQFENDFEDELQRSEIMYEGGLWQ